MRLPAPCGPVSAQLLENLRDGREPLPVGHGDGPVVADRDIQLSLWTIYELSYRGFDEVDPGREWDPDLIRLRREIEERLEQELRAATEEQVAEALDHRDDVGDLVLELVEEDDGPSLSAFLRREATAEQMRDFLRERSVQQLKESDPQAFLVPRLEGAAKVALAEIQYDEFGSGRPARLHQALYAQTLAAAGLDATYGAYLDDVSAVSLASANVMSLFALNRRLVAAGVGHFAAFEASSSVPSRRISAGLKRLGLAEAAGYFDEHVEADSVHEQVAARDLCGAVVQDRPDLLGEVVFGVLSALHVDGLSARELLARWADSDADRTAVAS